jgi:hypothetical protein
VAPDSTILFRARAMEKSANQQKRAKRENGVRKPIEVKILERIVPVMMKNVPPADSINQQYPGQIEEDTREALPQIPEEKKDEQAHDQGLDEIKKPEVQNACRHK